MSLIREGRQELFVEMYAEVDGKSVPNGFRRVNVPVSDPELTNSRDMDWSCEDDTDSDPLEIVVDVRQLAELIAKAAKWDALTQNHDHSGTTDDPS